jgi:hypothetical protein
MSSSPAIIHVLDKNDYSKHRLVTLRDAKLEPLAPSSIRIRSRILGQSTNNLTYARLGMFLGWYDVYPLPPTTPVPYNDSDKYGRISAWGYSEVVESTVPEITPGQTLFGYQPITTGMETVRVAFAEHNGKQISSQIVVLSEHRQHLWMVYNRYHLCPSLPELEKTKGVDSLGYDALMSVLFGTSYNMNRYGFAWKEENLIHPGGQGEWTAQDADLADTSVIIMNASGKTGMAFAYCLRQDRPKEYQPKRIIGVGSPASVKTIEKQGFCDYVVTNDDYESTKDKIEQAGAKRVVLFDFGARPGAANTWHDTFSASNVPYTRINVGSEVKVADTETLMKAMASMASIVQVNANVMREKGFELEGEKYIKEHDDAFDTFKTKVGGVQLQWNEGMEAWEKGWEAFCKDEVRADTGMVYRL